MKKKREKKNKKQKLEWATAYLVVELRYTMLYRDRHGLGAPGGATWPSGCVGARNGTPRYDQLGGDTAGLHVRRVARARAWLGRLRVCRDTINCIVTGRRLGRWVVLRDKCDTTWGGATIRCWRRSTWR